MAERRPPIPSPGALVLDFQGPFAPKVELVDQGASPFAVVHLFRNPDVAIYVTSDNDADTLIRALQRAKGLLPRG